MEKGRKKFLMGTAALALAGVLTVCGIASRVNNVKVEAAKNTLDGITRIVSENSAAKPFNILEIVPEKTVTIKNMDTPTGELVLPTGSIGWLISGNEPLDTDYVLTQLRSSQARREFMTKYEKGLSDITTDNPDPTVKPLYMVSYDEVIEDLASEALKTSGKKISPQTTQSVNGVSFNKVVDRSGMYVKTYINPSASGSANTAAKDFFGGDDTVFERSDSEGAFDPHFVYPWDVSDSDRLGRFSVSFKKNDAAHGSYKLAEGGESGPYSIVCGASWNEAPDMRGGLSQNTPLYKRNGDNDYEFVGYLVNDDNKISINQVPNFEKYVASYSAFHQMRFYGAQNTASGNEEVVPGPIDGGVTNPEPPIGTSENTVPEVPASEPSNNVIPQVPSGDNTPSGNTPSGNSTSDNTVSDNIPGVDNPVVPEENAGALSGNFYKLDIIYTDKGDGIFDINDYVRLAEDGDTTSMNGMTYSIDLRSPIVPNYWHTGAVNNKDDASDCICFNRTGASGNCIPVSDNSVKTRYVKNASFYIIGGFKNNEWFKRYVLDRTEQSEFDNFYTRVYTIKASEVSTYDLENADLIYISAKTGHLMPDYKDMTYPNYKKDENDLTKTAARTLLYVAAMRNKPVMVDYNILKDGNTDKDTYTYMVSRVLTSDDLKVGYNKFVSNYNTTGLITYRFDSDIDKAYVNDHVYVFNDFSDMNAGHTIVNGNFRTSDDTGDSRKKGGLEEVFDNITEENKKRPASKKLETIVHEGTCIRYILNQSKMNVLSTKGDIHILELEPMELDYSLSDIPAREGRKWIDGMTNDSLGGVQLNLSYDLSVSTSGNTANPTHVLKYTKHDSLPHDQIVESVDILETPGNIYITTMPMAEYIGKIEDLNSEYDMIFIGDDTSAMNHTTFIDVRANKWMVTYDTNTGTEYNDATMNGLIYSNVGDYNYISRKLIGAVKNDYKNKSVTNQPGDIVDVSDYKGETRNNGSTDYNSTIGRSRFSGNDIKQADIDKIYNFAKADYPVVFGDLLIEKHIDKAGKETGRTVSGQYVDNCSHLYQLIKKLLNDEGTKDNVFMISDITTNGKDANKKKMFIQSIGTLKPEIKMLSTGLDSNNRGTVTVTDTGNYLIDLKFRIDDVGSGAGSAYVGHFYTDLNADGKFAANEELKGTMVRFTDSAGNNVEQGSLSPGVEYRVICRLDSTFVAGVYPWKLSVVQSGNDRRRDCVTGYATVPLKEKKTIKVLQLTSPQHNKIELKTKIDLYKNNRTLGNGKKSALGYYLSNIPGFELEMTQMTSTKFIYDVVKAAPGAELTPDDYLNELRKYDMVIIGFADTYRWGNQSDISKENKAAEGLLGYIAEGNSVLFSHDTTSYYNVERAAEYNEDLDAQGPAAQWFWGFSFNQYMRNIVGMNRYGVPSRADSSTNPTVRALLSGQKFDTIYQPRSNPTGEEGKGIKLNDSQAHGLVNFTLIRGQITRGYWGLNWMDPEDMNNDDLTGKDSSYVKHYNNHYYSRTSVGRVSMPDGTTKVNRVNRGQLTEYPYELPASFDVTYTHGQYYQLNFDLDDDKDGESDVVVWYTLGSLNKESDKCLYNLYNMSGKDVRNNYFIYNRGNVTYTGQGHSSFSDDYDGYSTTPETAPAANECKLLVNTIIASYSAGTRGSQIAFHETGSADSKKIKSDIIPYDILYDQDTSTDEMEFPGAGRKVKGDNKSDPTMTTFIEINDTNIVYSKKIYVKFNRKPNLGEERDDIDNHLQKLEVIKITPLTDDGQVATGYRDVNASYDESKDEYLLYDSTNAQDISAVNAGKMFMVEYSLKDFKIPADSTAVGTTNIPGIAVSSRTLLQSKENGIVTEKTAEDDLMLIRAQLFNLK